VPTTNASTVDILKEKKFSITTFFFKLSTLCLIPFTSMGFDLSMLFAGVGTLSSYSN
jgi:hypothetical protein